MPFALANPLVSGLPDVLERVEHLAVQGVDRRPVRLLRREEMGAGGRENIEPPLPRRNQQQDGDENGVRWKEERDLAVREAQLPSDARGQIIASGAGQNPDCGANKERRSFLPPTDGG